jgi:hypothetical protein
MSLYLDLKAIDWIREIYRFRIIVSYIISRRVVSEYRLT